jgi:hypothetical protein
MFSGAYCLSSGYIKRKKSVKKKQQQEVTLHETDVKSIQG